jgi:metallophosphoesterase (TIGR00282 family)
VIICKIEFAVYFSIRLWYNAVIMINILCIGDVVGAAGCRFLEKHLPSLKRLKGIALTVVNGENSAQGNGMLPESAESLFAAGADVVTGGNHTFRRREVYWLLEQNQFLLRPGNFPASAPGKGLAIVDRGRYIAAVINIQGVVFSDALDSPFDRAKALIDEAKSLGAVIIALDFHAEATAEKKALAFFLDGEISAFFGTHTHVQTSDEQILPKGTGYITDLGMTGPAISVIGVKPEQSIALMRGKLPVRFEAAEGPCRMDGCIFTVDEKTGKTLEIERISIM